MNTLLKRQFTPENIENLPEREIFVFGSNLNGNHAGGAAKTALEKFRAIQGQAEGLQGQSYALPTLDENMSKLSLEVISKNIDTLYQFAKSRPDLTFWVTKIGCGIAGFDEQEIARLFKKKETPFNVFLPKEFTLIRGFKGFNKGLVCRDFQYEENTEYVHNGEVEACESGFHFCENPFDVFNYYEPHKSEFAQVEGWGDIDISEHDKTAVSHLKVKDKISIQSFVDKGIAFTRKKVQFFRDRADLLMEENTDNNAINSEGNRSVNSGGYESINSGGNRSV
ncbi:MAG: A1S_2505 family phage non-structural protein, partial [Bergeyella cardium]